MPGTVVRDLSGHGTHVASTIVQETNNRLALAGIAYRTRLMPLKVCLGYWDLMIDLGRRGVPGFPPPTTGACSSADVAAGIRHAVDNGARIINLSVSGPSPSQTERDALVYAAERGAFVTVAGGNEFDRGNPVQYPAAFAAQIDGVMSVGAVDKGRGRAPYSSTGTFIEIAAPGGSDFDDGSEDGGYVWQVTLFPFDVEPIIRRPRFDRFAEVGYTGTSMAAPHVAGLAALLMSQGVTNPRAIEAFLKASAKDIGPGGADTQFGHGLVQGRAGVFGMGVRR
jgi:serine protease